MVLYKLSELAHFGREILCVLSVFFTYFSTLGW